MKGKKLKYQENGHEFRVNWIDGLTGYVEEKHEGNSIMVCWFSLGQSADGLSTITWNKPRGLKRPIPNDLSLEVLAQWSGKFEAKVKPVRVNKLHDKPVTGKFQAVDITGRYRLRLDNAETLDEAVDRTTKVLSRQETSGVGTSTLYVGTEEFPHIVALRIAK